MHDERGWIVVASEVHVQPAVGELGPIDDGDRRIRAVYGRIGGVLEEELSEGIESAYDADAGDGSDCDSA